MQFTLFIIVSDQNCILYNTESNPRRSSWKQIEKSNDKAESEWEGKEEDEEDEEEEQEQGKKEDKLKQEQEDILKRSRRKKKM